MRAAIYFTPARSDALTVRAAEWLGRDAFGGRPARNPDSLLDPLVRQPARYGFHATLKAPFRLVDGITVDGLAVALGDFTQCQAALSLGLLSITRLSSFFALTAPEARTAVSMLEETVRTAFDPFRAPLSEAEIAKRQPDKLTDRQRENLARWGYPFIGPDYRFHMTLTGSIAEGPEASALEARLQTHFAPVLERPVILDALALFIEPEPGAAFHIHSRHPLRIDAPADV
jgi:hypothetical protein